jgi:ketosteroid isomerase-like protein
MLDFLKVNASKKKQTAGKRSGKPLGGGVQSLGNIRIDKFVFNIRELNAKGFIIDPYDKDIVITGQKFRLEIDAMDGQKQMKGRAEAVVTKIAGGALAAAFTSKFF